MRRNRPQVIAASLVLFALLAGFAGTHWDSCGPGKPTSSRAEAGEKLAGERLLQVEAEKKKTEEEKQIAVAVKHFLQKKLLGQADVSEQANALLAAGSQATAAKHDRTILELLNQAALELSEAKIESNFPNQPLLQAEILETVGTTYGGAGEPGRAIDFLQRSLALRKAMLGPDHPDTLASMNNLAAAYNGAGKLDLAVPLHKATLNLLKTKLGPDHPQTLYSMSNLAGAYLEAGNLDLALPLHEETLKLRKAKLGPDHPDTLTSMNNLALAYAEPGSPTRPCHSSGRRSRSRKPSSGPNIPSRR